MKICAKRLRCEKPTKAPNGTTIIWISLSKNDEHVATARIFGTTCSVETRNESYRLAALEILKKDFPQYHWPKT